MFRVDSASIDTIITYGCFVVNMFLKLFCNLRLQSCAATCSEITEHLFGIPCRSPQLQLIKSSDHSQWRSAVHLDH